jgi:hypothetical protein
VAATSAPSSGCNAAADAVAAGREVGAPDYRAALIRAALAYRHWAVDAPHVFRPVYGDLIPGYRAPVDGPTAGLGRRLGHEFAEACFPGWTPQQFAVLAALLDRTTGSSPAEGAPPRGAGSLGAMPPVIRLHFGAWWAQLHGLISLEVYGHLSWVGVNPACTYRTAVEELADRIHALTEQS